MVANPWEISDNYKYGLLTLGLDLDRIRKIEENRRELFEEMVAKRGPEFEDHYYNKYGFEHTCHCLEDHLLNDTAEVTHCNIEKANKAFEHLEKVLIERDQLTEVVHGLRKQVYSLGGEPLE